MKRILLAFFFPLVAFAQEDVALTKELVNTDESASHVWFLASDELRGRETGSPEIDIAARYIADQYRKFGVQPIDGSYFQQVPLQSVSPPSVGSIQFNGMDKHIGKDFVLLASSALSTSGEVVYLGFESPRNWQKKQVENKIIVTKTGLGEDNPGAAFAAARDKRAKAAELGAVALIEIYSLNAMPWANILRYLNRSSLSFGDSESNDFNHVWMNDPDGTAVAYLESKKAKVELAIGEMEIDPMPSKNVIGVIEGTDSTLKNEYILLSAHYDHVGVKSNTNGEDSIFNGARDNAVGVAAILTAAQSLAASPAKRSILLLACTGEEKGLLGSRYFADHSPIELNKIVYNLNIDGGGYNDVTKVSVMGLSRTTAEKEIIASAEAFGLEAFGDPAPEQNLFDRSDNVSFAAKGIPAPTYSTGFTEFDEEIMKYYHKVTDNPDNLDYEYLSKYFLSYALLVRKVANMDETPFWLPGDKYEAAGKALYNR